MGCDIHIYVEQKSSDGKWYNRDYYVPLQQAATGIMYERVPIISHRSYALFSILANVRNYNCIPFLDDPRGVPLNLSEYVQNEWEYWVEDAHSSSYFTLRELIEAQNDAREWDCESPIWPIAINNLAGLVKELKKRAEELGLIYYFEWDSPRPETKKKVMGNAEKLRIVFWFDN